MNAQDVKRVAEAVNKFLWMQAKADWLEYKNDGGEDGSLKWLHDNYPGLFNLWQDGVCNGDWIFAPMPGQEEKER